MDLELYGGWAQPIDATWLPPVGEVYIVSARCAAGCHRLAEIARGDDQAALGVAADRMREAFRRVHP